MAEVSLIATAAFGLEAVVARELKAVGYSPRVENGGAFYHGSRAIGANLWLRSADRVQLLLEFEARTFDELFQQTKALPGKTGFPKTANSGAGQVCKIPTSQCSPLPGHSEKGHCRKAEAEIPGAMVSGNRPPLFGAGCPLEGQGNPDH